MTQLVHHVDGCVYPAMVAPHWSWDSPPSEAFTLEKDDAPVSIVRVFHRRLVGTSLAFNVIGIGGVFTQPPYRGQHHGSRLVAAVCAAVERRAILAAVLYATPERHNFYARLGFLRVQPYLYIKSLVPGLTFDEETPQVPVPRWSVVPEGRF